MTLTVAATSGNITPISAVQLAGLALIVAFCYAACCWIKPFTHCHRCEGVGTSPRRASDWLRYRTQRPQPRAARGAPRCPRCRGTGLRLRIGRRFANFLIRRYRSAR